MARPLTINGLKAGLNNQKLAIAGLLSIAQKKNVPVVLPKLVDFIATSPECIEMGIGDVFSLDDLEGCCAMQGVDLIKEHSDPDLLDGWQCFSTAANELTMSQKAGGLSRETPVVAFLGKLCPNTEISCGVKQVSDWLRQNDISLGVQLRIERDWATYVQKTLTERLGAGEDYNLDHNGICAKIHRFFDGRVKDIYVTCNESDLPIPKQQIYEDVNSRFSYRIFWKSDIVANIDTIKSSIGKALLDFEISLTLDHFVGLTRSTFFNVAAVTSFARNSPGETFYAYNVAGPNLMIRTDNGAFADPVAATKA